MEERPCTLMRSNWPEIGFRTCGKPAVRVSTKPRRPPDRDGYQEAGALCQSCIDKLSPDPTPEQLKDIEKAQFTHYNGEEEARIPFGGRPGDEWHVEFGLRCHDCGCLPGQYHQPGCDTEMCPKCGGQAIGCSCTSNDDDDE